jgi:hypothetical protein
MVNKVSCVALTGGFTTVALWTWCHTGARIEIMPEGSMEIKHVDEEPYHITHYLHLMLLYDSYLC